MTEIVQEREKGTDTVWQNICWPPATYPAFTGCSENCCTWSRAEDHRTAAQPPVCLTNMAAAAGGGHESGELAHHRRQLPQLCHHHHSPASVSTVPLAASPRHSQGKAGGLTEHRTHSTVNTPSPFSTIQQQIMTGDKRLGYLCCR